MKTRLLALVCLLLPTPALAQDDIDELAAKVNQLADEFVSFGLQEFPEIGTMFGIPMSNHAAISDNSLESLEEARAKEDAWMEELVAIDVQLLEGRAEAITYGFMREQLEASIQSRVCRSELWEIDQLGGWHIMYPRLAKVQPVGDGPEREAALERYSQLDDYIDMEVTNLREGVAQGYTAPPINVQRVIEGVEALMGESATASPFFDMAKRDPDPSFMMALSKIIRDEIYPAMGRYRDYLRDEYLAAAREEVGVAAIPNGEECYRAVARGYTTLDIPAREIHEMGLAQMKLIRGEMLELAKAEFGTDDLPQLLRDFKTEEEYLFTSREEMIEFSEEAIGRAKAIMADWFGMLPQADLVVEPYAPHEEESASGAQYERSPADGSRPATFRLNTHNAEATSRVGIMSTAFHESIPGHHLQVAIQQERPAAHLITQYLGNSGFIEGWALYAERLADEMGLFPTAQDQMGMLSQQAFRAARMVVDPGVHVLGWDRERAIQYLLDHTAMSEVKAANEVDRYIIRPGQAVAYMVGSMEIFRLRALAEERLGEAFDIKAFHDTVLGDGSVTLPMLRAKIERWTTTES